jgi:hypothetical protein
VLDTALLVHNGSASRNEQILQSCRFSFAVQNIIKHRIIEASSALLQCREACGILSTLQAGGYPVQQSILAATCFNATQPLKHHIFDMCCVAPMQGGVRHPVDAAGGWLPGTGGCMAGGGRLAMRQHACALWQAQHGGSLYGGRQVYCSIHEQHMLP